MTLLWEAEDIPLPRALSSLEVSLAGTGHLPSASLPAAQGPYSKTSECRAIQLSFTHICRVSTVV